MPNFIIVYNNVVENVIVGESLDAIKSLFPNVDVIEQTSENQNASVGWTYDGLEFHAPQVEEPTE